MCYFLNLLFICQSHHSALRPIMTSYQQGTRYWHFLSAPLCNIEISKRTWTRTKDKSTDNSYEKLNLHLRFLISHCFFYDLAYDKGVSYFKKVVLLNQLATILRYMFQFDLCKIFDSWVLILTSQLLPWHPNCCQFLN